MRIWLFPRVTALSFACLGGKSSLIDWIFWQYLCLESSLVAAPEFVVDGEEWENSSPLGAHKASLTCVDVFVFRCFACHRGKVYFPFQAEQTELWIWHRRTIVCPNASTEAGECLPLSCLRTRHRTHQGWLPKTAAQFVNSLVVVQATRSAVSTGLGKCCILTRRITEHALFYRVHLEILLHQAPETAHGILILTALLLYQVRWWWWCSTPSESFSTASYPTYSATEVVFLIPGCLMQLGFHSNKS